MRFLPSLRGGTAAAFCATLAACGRHKVPSPSGACTVNEPGTPTQGGVAAYAEHVTPTAGGGFGLGSLAVTITCVTPGPAADHVDLILPNLRRGERPTTGEYRVRNPYATRTTAELTDPRMAWVRVQRGAAAPVLYTGEGGRITVTRSESGLLEGAYEVALAPADTAVSLPGAQPEVSGPVATGPGGARLTSRTVLGGAFVAHRREADWHGR